MSILYNAMMSGRKSVVSPLINDITTSGDSVLLLGKILEDNPKILLQVLLDEIPQKKGDTQFLDTLKTVSYSFIS
jgi:hypothetical protein